MPKQPSISTVLVIGSGPIVIGQAAEFDYAGTQACLALKEEGIKVILVNNNPATVMTDEACADVVYFEPLTVDSIEKIIQKEKPDGLLATLGGQTGLNLALALHKQGILEKYDVDLLGTPIESIIKGEDREEFRALMHDLNEPVPESEIIETVEAAVAFANQVGYPIIVRPAYTLGGGGGGIVHNEEELRYIVAGGLDASPITQCLIEKSIAGFKEIEYEVMRDENDTCITVCNMENIDPVGVHTGDSIVVAPSQTLTDVEYQMLRSVSVKIIRALGIVGGCNIQFALDPNSKQYYLIEVNPRVSRSSALASKATGYPIARMAAKLSLGYHLHELLNPVTGHTYASFEPALDYVVVKFPRWPFDKFVHANRQLGTQMKATGEVMAIERNLESGFQKAIRSLEIKTNGLMLPALSDWDEQQLWDVIVNPDDRRFFAILELIRREVDIQDIHNRTRIDLFFLSSWKKLIGLEKLAKARQLASISTDELYQLKVHGFSDQWLAESWGESLEAVRQKRKAANIVPSYKMVDTCAGEFSSSTAYFYSSWRGEHDVDVSSSKKKILIVGSGPIRIGQGIEFDYCSVHGAISLKKMGYEAIIMNNNPETVSTDYEMADRLYFEPLTIEDVLNVVELEQVEGVIVQVGGQTAISLVEGLEKAGVTIYGTTNDTIDQLEDRARFYQFMNKVDVPHIPGVTAYDENELIEKAEEIGFPVLLRPSYVIGGQGMVIHSTKQELLDYIHDKEQTVMYPILIDAYLPGTEIEVDALTDGTDILIPGMFEHVEKAGVHSGDSMAITPPVSLTDDVKELVCTYTKQIAEGMDFKGIFNIQFVYHEETLYVIEINPRASRTVPILSKITGIQMIDYTIQLLLGKKLKEITTQVGYAKETPYYTVKAPIFSHAKLPGLDPLLEAEMKSTGELISIGHRHEEALKKAFAWSEGQIPALYQQEGMVFCDVVDEEWEAFVPSAKRLIELGFTLVAEQEKKLDGNNEVKAVSSFDSIVEESDALALISIPKKGHRTGSTKRQLALKNRLTVITELSTLEKMLASLTVEDAGVKSIQEWLGNVNESISS
ncbi:carbamoyl phosphate synthase large subunit [Desertibacillus haloalkaliphilus]|uniref:carbamoyl phosphate synthase large subunit n=1 Tax=Desertibacillus haloalkaliphilus TaxID=1328930 RepID=UPI001C27D00B|nr:carbamoyl phosphate synthase large subunit [Desertibacillus haloalkaliphilus]MBU8908340.1 carbamoyl phosphate synthase large subunit [Desertibacillus haloalkaliphilus]